MVHCYVHASEFRDKDRGAWLWTSVMKTTAHLYLLQNIIVFLPTNGSITDRIGIPSRTTELHYPLLFNNFVQLVWLVWILLVLNVWCILSIHSLIYISIVLLKRCWNTHSSVCQGQEEWSSTLFRLAMSPCPGAFRLVELKLHSHPTVPISLPS